MRPIVILEHSPNVPPGYLADAIAAAGLPTEIFRLHAGDPLPRLETAAAVVSLGGIMGAYDAEQYPSSSMRRRSFRRRTMRVGQLCCSAGG